MCGGYRLRCVWQGRQKGPDRLDTLRLRDSSEQERVKISEPLGKLLLLVS